MKRRRNLSACAAAACLLLPGVAARAADDNAASKPAAAAAPETPPAAPPGVPTGETLSVVRALDVLPGTGERFARLYRTVLLGGTLAPETKMAMGLRVGKQTGVPYVAAHMTRLLQASPAGRRLLSGKAEPDEALALAFAERLTRDVQGEDAAGFAALRGRFNDAQIVELTVTTCFFNYLARMAAGTGASPEAWAARPARPEDVVRLAADKAAAPPPEARVTLASDAELAATERVRNPLGNRGGLGYVANSLRAMVRVPDMMTAWFDYWRAVREHQATTQAERLHVSFAVSMLNGCRYCTLHQVQNLRKQGVDVAKLVAMKKDDAALSPREMAAVAFARKLSATPGTVGAQDREALRAVFGEQGSAEIVLQTGAFAFMNRFTDSLRLPSEDEAVRVYQEVYGPGAYETYRAEFAGRPSAKTTSNR
jgi:uncharacterized peroxidase-related enzyme